MTPIEKKSNSNYNDLIDDGIRRAHVERSRAFYDFWSQVSTRFTNRTQPREG